MLDVTQHSRDKTMGSTETCVTCGTWVGTGLVNVCVGGGGGGGGEYVCVCVCV